jgi:parvulin-like peptidyl-prolyl isomerase
MGFMNRFGSKNTIQCAHILVNTKKEAENVLNRVKQGEDFSKIANRVSRCPSSKKGGNLGKFGKGKMVKEFEDAAFALQKDEVSSIVKTQFGYHIIKRLK